MSRMAIATTRLHLTALYYGQTRVALNLSISPIKFDGEDIINEDVPGSACASANKDVHDMRNGQAAAWFSMRSAYLTLHVPGLMTYLFVTGGLQVLHATNRDCLTLRITSLQERRPLHDPCRRSS